MSFIKNFLNFLRIYKVGLKLAYVILICFIFVVLSATRKSYLMETIFISSPFFTALLNWKIIRYPIVLLTYILGGSHSKTEEILSIYPTAYYIILCVLLIIGISLLIMKFVSPLIITPMFGVLAYLCRQTLINYHKQDPIIYNGFFNWIKALRILTPEEKNEIVTNYLNWKLQQNLTLEKIISLIEQEQYIQFTGATTRQEIERNVEQYLEILQAQQMGQLAAKSANQGWISYLPDIVVNHPVVSALAIAICVTTLAVVGYLIISGKGSEWVSGLWVKPNPNPPPTDVRIIAGPKGRPEIWTLYSDYEKIVTATPQELMEMADKMLAEPLRGVQNTPHSLKLPRHQIESATLWTGDEYMHVRIKQPHSLEYYQTVPDNLRALYDSRTWTNRTGYFPDMPDDFWERPDVIYQFNRLFNPEYVDTSMSYSLGFMQGIFDHYHDRVFAMTNRPPEAPYSYEKYRLGNADEPLANGTDFALDSEGFGLIMTLLIISARIMVNVALND